MPVLPEPGEFVKHPAFRSVARVETVGRVWISLAFANPILGSHRVRREAWPKDDQFKGEWGPAGAVM